MNRFIVAAAVLLVGGSVAVAQGWAGGACPGPGRGGGYGPATCAGSGACAGGGQGAGCRRAFDPATVTTTSGQVESVQAAGGRGHGVFLQVRTSDRGVLDVRLGPSWYLEQQKLTVAKGDQLELTGSIVQAADGAFMVAQHVKKGPVAVTLRDANGLPSWAGWRHR